MTFQTEFNFTLPHGFVDTEGNLHKNGVMRLATAFDEIAPMKDPRVQVNPAYANPGSSCNLSYARLCIAPTREDAHGSLHNLLF